MKILAIETSFDETAISIVDFSDKDEALSYTVFANLLHSQFKTHEQYGGVVPNLAKEQHAHDIVPMLEKALHQAGLLKNKEEFSVFSFQFLANKLKNVLKTKNLKLKTLKILEREPEAAEELIKILESIKKPDIDAIAVTVGPGLEPALWVGVNVAKALSTVWNIPFIPCNHMEGHMLSAFIDNYEIGATEEISMSKDLFPSMALLISGAHTELVLMKDFGVYEKVGQTRDDAVGEAFDKVARLLGLPYPGGPNIEKAANHPLHHPSIPSSKRRGGNVVLPRPMLNSGDLDFSFSGIKTAVRYLVESLGELDDTQRSAIAKEFQDAVTEVLVAKAATALEKYDAKNLIISGGVSANNFICSAFQNKFAADFPEATLFIPPRKLSTDNALMIAFAGYFTFLRGGAKNIEEVKAEGNLSL